MVECMRARDMTPLPPRTAKFETEKGAHHRVFSMTEQHASRGDPIHAGSRGELWATIADEWSPTDFVPRTPGGRSCGSDTKRSTFPRSQSQGTLSRATTAEERSVVSRR